MEDLGLKTLREDVDKLKQCAALSAQGIDQLKGVIEALVEKLFESKAGFVSVINEQVAALVGCSSKLVVDVAMLSRRVDEIEQNNSSILQ